MSAQPSTTWLLVIMNIPSAIAKPDPDDIVSPKQDGILELRSPQIYLSDNWIALGPQSETVNFLSENTQGRTFASPYGVLCSPAPTRRGAGSSSRTRNTPPVVSTFAPTHHRATDALATVASLK